MKSQRPLVTIKEIGRIAGRHRNTIRVWVNREDFPSPKVSIGKRRYWSRTEVNDWVGNKLNQS